MPSSPRSPDAVTPEAASPGEERGTRSEEESQPGAPLLSALLELQTDFLRGGDPQRSLERWLTLLLGETGGEHGLLGVELQAPGVAPAPQLQVLASTPPGWGAALWEVPAWLTPGDAEPRSLQALVSLALSTGQPLSAEGPVKVPGSAPLPMPEPSPRSFRVLPLQAGDARTGFVGFTHRPGEATAEASEDLLLLLDVGDSLLRSRREAQQQEQTQQAAHHLQEELEALRQTLASVEDDLWIWNAPTRELRVSRRWREIAGYAENELAPTFDAWKQLCHPEDLPRIQSSLQAHAEGTTPHAEFEYRTRCKDGEWAWILSRARVAARDEQGKPIRIVGTDTDLTAMKRSEERLSALLLAIPDLIFRLRGDGTYIDFSCSTSERTLLAPEEFIGRNMRDLPMPQYLNDLWFSNLDRVLRDGALAVYEYELDMPQGRQSYEARVVRSGPDEVVSIIRNITERRLVEERQAQLIQAEKLASLGQMAAGLAHEINNPVSYVASNLRALDEYASAVGPLLRMLREFLEEPGTEPRTLSAEQLARMRQLWQQGELDELLSDMPELIQESLTGTRRIKEIAQSLRVFAREDDGQPQSVDVNEELESTLRMVSNELKYKCDVKRDFGPLPRITCFPTQLVQVFTNLLLNAAQAIETRGEIRIRTWQRDTEVVVEISDTGKGMTAETISKLFTPFFTTKPRGQGTGLGLSISRDIVNRHGGRIEVRSEPGKGSTFTVTLPLSPP
ncbi:ATP-binding protein [Hyalangium sp.]|uniref:ATP-binding protein n=1 Tax=Hyalangium sp. TaxID=2028555 RepID=UPI002D663254|nr:ATP-binding protein [Hyalangium sp.]HYH98429.1 ATP-binding protein [Hyalangium sp.]